MKIITLQVLKAGHKLRDCYSVRHLIAILEDIFWNDRYQQSGLARAYNYCVIISHLSYRVTCFHKVWSCFLHSNHIAWSTWSWVKLLHCRIQWSLNRQILHFCYHVMIFFIVYVSYVSEGSRRCSFFSFTLQVNSNSYGKSCVSHSWTFQHSAGYNTWKTVAQRQRLQGRNMVHSRERTCSTIKMKHGARDVWK